LRILSQFRGARFLALITLGMLACVAAAGARSGSTDDTPAKQPTTTKTHKQHKTSTTSASTTKSTGKTHTASAGKHSSRKKRPKGQQKIDSERAQAIQEALIREHYLTGEATGTWSQSSEEAMRRYQADHGWQSKTVPDSRALISLGLGPSKDHLLNPESAMTTVPDATRAEPMPTTSHSASPTTTTTPVPAGQTDPSSPQ
jgi:peptidoglycan hydrolase-like protein with peptidoglycan-binding domain